MTYLACLQLAGLSYVSLLASQQCGRHSCHGDVGNLGAGRSVTVSSTCGENSGEFFCEPGQDDCSPLVCRRCKSGKKLHEHPASHMLDSPFLRPHTWWQSSSLDDDVTIQFDLETAFYFTHLIIVFKSSRPGAMTLERSVDFGRTWQVRNRSAL